MLLPYSEQEAWSGATFALGLDEWFVFIDPLMALVIGSWFKRQKGGDASEQVQRERKALAVVLGLIVVVQVLLCAIPVFVFVGRAEVMVAVKSLLAHTLPIACAVLGFWLTRSAE